MNADERLTEILRAEAEEVDPSPAGFERIRDKIGARRHRVIWQRSLVAAAASLALIATGVVVFTGNDGDQKIGLSTPTPTVSESASAAPSPTPILSNEPYPAVWPFTSQAEIAAWTPTQYPALQQHETTALAYLNEMLGRHDFRTRLSADLHPDTVEVEVLRTDGNREVVVSTVTVKAFGESGGEPGGPWVVLSARNSRLAITEPAGESAIRSPLSLRGTIGGVDEQVLVEVREAHINREPLGTGNFRGGQQGWSGTVSFTQRAGRGALTAHTGSFLDGKPVTFAAIPVSIGSTSAAPASAAPMTFVGVESSELALYRTSDGARQRFLTDGAEFGGYVGGPVLAKDGTTVYFVRHSDLHCGSDIHATNTTGATEHEVVNLNGGEASSLTVSADGRYLAYVKTGCVDRERTEQAVVLRDLSAGTERSWSWTASPPESGQVGDMALSTNGSRLYFLHVRQDKSVRVRELDTTEPGNVLDEHSAVWAPVKVGGTIRHLNFSEKYGVTISSDWESTQRVSGFQRDGTATLLFFADVDSLDWDLSGRNAIYSVSAGNGVNRLWRWSEGGEQTEIVAGPAGDLTW